MSKRRPRPFRSNPRVTIVDQGKDGYGRTTVSGLFYDDLRQILTGAALNCYANLKKDHADPEARAYYERELKLIKLVEDRVKDAIASTFPKNERKPTVAERRKAIETERRERILIDSLVEMAINKKLEVK